MFESAGNDANAGSDGCTMAGTDQSSNLMLSKEGGFQGSDRTAAAPRAVVVPTAVRPENCQIRDAVRGVQSVCASEVQESRLQSLLDSKQCDGLEMQPDAPEASALSLGKRQ